MTEPAHGASDPRRELYDVYVSAFKGDEQGRSRGATFHRLLHLLDPMLGELGGEPRVADVGCGGGELLATLAERYRLSRAVGVDLSAEQVALARRRGVEAEVGDAIEFLGAEQERFDLITAIDLLEHLRKDELLRLLPCVRRALRPGGCFVAQTPNGEGLFAGSVIYGDLTHETILCTSSLIQLFRHSGLERIRVVEVAPVGRSRIPWLLLRQLVGLAKRIESGKRQRVWTENMPGIAFRPSAADDEAAGTT